MIMKNKKRNIGLDLLRICSMLMIILLHSIDHSGLYEKLIPGEGIYYYEIFLFILVQVCVNCFVLISGYFLVKSEFKIKKLAQLWIEVVFYSLVIKLILMAAGEIPFSVGSLISCFVPITTGRYWFITIYFGMYLLAPFYNITISNMNKQMHKKLLIILFVLFSCMISIHPAFKGMNSGAGWGLAWFTVLYFTAAYFNYYYEAQGKMFRYLTLFFVIPLMITLIIWILNEIIYIDFVKQIVFNWIRYDSVPVYLASVFIFVAFLNYKGKINDFVGGIITKVSGSIFGVYLIHAHANICTVTMWNRIGIGCNVDSMSLIPIQIVAVLVIFVICVLIDIVRTKLFELLKVDYLLGCLFDR